MLLVATEGDELYRERSESRSNMITNERSKSIDTIGKWRLCSAVAIEE